MNNSQLKKLKWLQRLVMSLLFFPFVARDYLRFRSLLGKSDSPRFALDLMQTFPWAFDKTLATSFDRHYIYHTSWAARRVRQINPPYHVDISSSLYFSS